MEGKLKRNIVLPHFLNEWYIPQVHTVLDFHTEKGQTFDKLGKMVEPEIGPRQAKKALDTLVELDLIGKKNGVYFTKKPNVKTKLKVTKKLRKKIVKYHLDVISKTANRIYSAFDADERTSLMIAKRMTKAQYRGVERLMISTKERIWQLLGGEYRGNVGYRFNFQMCPINNDAYNKIASKTTTEARYKESLESMEKIITPELLTDKLRERKKVRHLFTMTLDLTDSKLKKVRKILDEFNVKLFDRKGTTDERSNLYLVGTQFYPATKKV